MSKLEDFTPSAYFSDSEAALFRARLTPLERKLGRRAGDLEKLFAFITNSRYWGENIWEVDEELREEDREWLEEALGDMVDISFEELTEEVAEEADSNVNRCPWDYLLIYLALRDFNQDWANRYLERHNLADTVSQIEKKLWDETEKFHKETANVSVWEWKKDTALWRLGYLLNDWVRFQEEVGSEEYEKWSEADQDEFQHAWSRLGFEIGEVLGTLLARRLVSSNAEITLPYIENRVKVGELMYISGLTSK